MLAQIPKALKKLPARRLVLHTIDNDAVLFLSEDSWNLRKYPRSCAFEARLLAWDIDGVLATTLVTRLARKDISTFDTWIDAGEPEGVRKLQCLAGQSVLELHVFGGDELRSFRIPNPVKIDASQLVDMVRSREAWNQERYQDACRRMIRLYPTAAAVWWASNDEPR